MPVGLKYVFAIFNEPPNVSLHFSILLSGYSTCSKTKAGYIIQDKGDVASLWTMTSSIIVYAHALLHAGLVPPSVIGKTGNKKNNDAYADDVDTWAGSLDYGQIELHIVICKLTEGAQKWSNIQNVAAASASFPKCITQLLGHIVVASSLVFNYDFEFNMDLLDIKQARTRIPLVLLDQPNEGLGLCLAPDGNQKHEFVLRVEKTKHMCKAAVSMPLRQYDAFILITCRLVP